MEKISEAEDIELHANWTDLPDYNEEGLPNE